MPNQDVRTTFTVNASDAIEALNRLSNRAKDVNVQFDAIGNATIAFNSSMRVSRNQIQAQAELMQKNTLANRNFAKSLAEIVAGENKATVSTERLTKSQSRLNNAMDRFSRAFRSATVRTTSFTDSLNKLRTASYLAEKALFGIGRSISSSIKYMENLNLFTVAFGEATDQAWEFSNAMASAFGINPANLTRTAGLFYQVSTSLGLTNDKAMTLAKNWTKLAYDISSMYNIGFDEAVTKLMAGLVGETEPLRRVGIVITENNLALTAQQLGITKSIRNMTEAEKIQLRYVTALQQTTNAQGDFARTFSSPANQLRILQEQMEIFMREVGTLFIPLIEKWVGRITAFFTALAQIIHDFNEENGFSMEKYIEGVNTETSDWGQNLKEVAKFSADIFTNLTKVLRTARQLNNTFQLGIDELNVLSPNSSSSSGVGGILGDELSQGIEQIDIAMEGYNNMIGESLTAFRDMTEEMKDSILTFAEEISSAMEPATRAINDFFTAINQDFGGGDFTQTILNVVTVASQIVAGIFDAFLDIYNFLSDTVEAVTGSSIMELFGLQKNDDGSISVINDNLRDMSSGVTKIVAGLNGVGLMADLISHVLDIAGFVSTIAGWKLTTALLSVAVVSWLAKEGINWLVEGNERQFIKDYGETGILQNPAVSLFGREGNFSEDFAKAVEEVNSMRRLLMETGTRSATMTFGEGEDAYDVEVLNPQYIQDLADAWKYYQRNIYWPNSATGRYQRESELGWTQTKDFEVFKSEIYDADWFQELFRNGYSDAEHRRRTPNWFMESDAPAESSQQRSIDDWQSKTLGIADEDFRLRQYLDAEVAGAYVPLSVYDPVAMLAKANAESDSDETVVDIAQPSIEEISTAVAEGAEEGIKTALEEVSTPIPTTNTDSAGTPEPVTVEVEQKPLPRVPLANFEAFNELNRMLFTTNNAENGGQFVETFSFSLADYIKDSLENLVISENRYGLQTQSPLSLPSSTEAPTITDYTDPSVITATASQLLTIVRGYAEENELTLPEAMIRYFEGAQLQPGMVKSLLSVLSTLDSTMGDVVKYFKDTYDGTDVTYEGAGAFSALASDITNAIEKGTRREANTGTESTGFDIDTAETVVNGLTSFLNTYINTGLIYRDENGKYQSNISQDLDQATQEEIGQNVLESFSAFMPTEVGKWWEFGIELASALSDGLLTAIVEDLPDILDFIADFVTGVTKGIAEEIPNILNALMEPDFWTSIVDSIIMSIISSLQMIPSILELASTVIEMLVEGLVEGLPKIIAVFADPRFWSDILNTLIQLAVFLVENVGTIISVLIEAIPKICQALIDAVFDINWMALGWNLIVYIAQGIVNGIISLVETVINGFLDGLSSIWTWTGLPGIPHVNFGRVDFSGSLMAYATGGFPPEGELFIARESGAEMVGTLGGRTAVANNDQIVDGIRAGVYDAVTEAIANSDSGGNKDVIVYLDGKKIYQNQRRVARRTGLGFGMEGL